VQRRRITHQVGGTGIALSVVAGIGWLDAATGPDVGFSLFSLESGDAAAHG